ncbi:MAG: molybdopterin-dependent oxidoreductase [Bacteroidales bacterium]
MATKLADARDKHGSHSVLWIKGSGNSGLVNDTGYFFWKAFGGVTTTYGNLCWPAGLEAVRLTLGSVKHNVPWDIANASTIVIWGKNPPETNIQEMAFIGSARKKGAKVILIDPRRTPTADKADIHYRPIPGTDAVLALACCGVIIREGLADIGFIKQNVLGFKEFSESSLPLPEEAGSICGIPAEEI